MELDRLKICFDGLMWSKGVSKNLDSNIENPGVSFVGMTQLSTFLPRCYHKMMESGGVV